MSTEWNGEGLPPVGCECEVKRAVDWLPCKIVFISDFHVIVQAQEEICWQTQACQFRPMLTAADRKRKEACKAMTDRIDMGNYPAGIIYDDIAAGKIPHITLK